MWVAISGSNNVTKLLATTGEVVSTYAVGSGPTAIAFDGTNMWVVNNGSNTVTELQASTGRLVRLLRTETARYDQVNVVTVEDSLGVLSLEPQGRYALVQGIQFGWLDVGGPDPGRFTPLPAVPAGQYVNFAAW